jgi:hypothetical protein
MSVPTELFYGGYGFYGWPYGGVSTAQIPAVAPEKPAKPSEPLERFDALGASGMMPGFGKAPPPSPLVYWHMRKYSACVLAYVVTTAPIFAGTRTATIRNADDEAAKPATPTGTGVQVVESQEDKRRKLCEDIFEDQWADVLQGLECLNFGHLLQEVDWGRTKDVIAPIAFRPFSPFDTVQLDRTKQGDFNGYRYNNETRDPRYAFHAVCNPQFDRLRGVPRAEFAREAWWRAIQSQDNGDRIERKASGIQMMLEMMTGASWKDANGDAVLNRTMVQTIVDAAASGKTFTVPLIPFRKEDLMAKPELAEMPAVRVKEFDWGQTGQALEAAIARLSRLDVEIMRSWGRPEREAMEGQHGTKAEAGTHGAIGTLDSEQVHSSFLRQFNRQVVDRFLVTNFGPEAAGSIYFKPAPLSDPQQEFKQAVVQALLASATEGPEATSHLDTRKLLKETELPMVSEEEAAKAQADAEAKAAEKAKQEAANKQPVGLNGEGQKLKLALERHAALTEKNTLAASRISRLLNIEDDEDADLGVDGRGLRLTRETPAPVVNIAAGAIALTIPEQPAPSVTVNLPKPGRVVRTLTRDKDGKPTGSIEEPIDE